LCVITSAAVVPAQAIEPVATDQLIEFKADEVTYDSRNNITRARGNVEADASRSKARRRYRRL
jgi:hypothetical protein